MSVKYVASSPFVVVCWCYVSHSVAFTANYICHFEFAFIHTHTHIFSSSSSSSSFSCVYSLIRSIIVCWICLLPLPFSLSVCVCVYMLCWFFFCYSSLRSWNGFIIHAAAEKKIDSAASLPTDISVSSPSLLIHDGYTLPFICPKCTVFN